jgi:hypothetical protein
MRVLGDYDGPFLLRVETGDHDGLAELRRKEGSVRGQLDGRVERLHHGERKEKGEAEGGSGEEAEGSRERRKRLRLIEDHAGKTRRERSPDTERSEVD